DWNEFGKLAMPTLERECIRWDAAAKVRVPRTQSRRKVRRLRRSRLKPLLQGSLRWNVGVHCRSGFSRDRIRRCTSIVTAAV
ncbi:hypothetical protein, partial [Xanthomonas graminis]|uniref:hypothetical protein n=1 Tax=Xanthomonas graminis TaxID=3390026 RepID=UPI001C2F1D37